MLRWQSNIDLWDYSIYNEDGILVGRLTSDGTNRLNSWYVSIWLDRFDANCTFYALGVDAAKRYVADMLEELSVELKKVRGE